jgi:uncharacterized protein (DUF2141 family)
MDRTISIELRNIKESSGRVYIAIYNSETSYKKDIPFKSFIIESSKNIINITDTFPEGYYVISAFQDLNNNGRLDLNFLGIPKEPIALSNYDGRGIPGGYEKLKIKISDDNQKIVINMIKML